MHLFEIHHHAPTQKFFMQDNRDKYLPLNADATKRQLKLLGLNGTKAQGDLMSQVEQCMAECVVKNSCEYAGPLAGHTAGLKNFKGSRVLVTDDPHIIKGENKPFPMIEQILSDLFIGESTDQLFYVFGWLQMARRMLTAGKPMPGQALVMAGPRNCGKNLFQDLITEMLGGRVARPYRYMTGKTEFNADLFQAEHLMIADEAPFHDITSRRLFGTRIKDFAVNQYQSCHGKHKDALILAPCWRLTISVNDESENLVMLPPLDNSIEDKIMLFKVQQAEMPMECDSPEGRSAFWDALLEELPGFIYFVEEMYKIAPVHKCPRFGIKAFHHPSIVEVLEDMAPEARLAELIDVVIQPNGVPWRGTLQELETRLLDDPTYRSRVEKLLSYPTALKTYMRRLHTARPDNYFRTKTNGRSVWSVSSVSN